MCRQEMIDHIVETVQSVDDATLESFYWFLIMELEL